MECFLLKKRFFNENKVAVSIMHDVVFFIVMVSLSGAILTPALQSRVAIETSIDKHRENVADEVLNTFLVSRVDKLSYTVGGDIIDDIAGSIGIDNSSDGLYRSILNWLLAREQLHKTFSNLISENLGCQIRLPFSTFGDNRFNIFTADYDQQLKKNIKAFLDSYIGDKYDYNFTAVWHPIKGVKLGGEINIGPSAPSKDCYVSKSNIIMPYKPTITINGTKINFTRYWFEEEVLKKISIVDNITMVIHDYNAGFHPYENRSNASIAIKENITVLLYGFLVDGIYKDEEQLFPGVASATIEYSLSNLRDAFDSFSESTMDMIIGEAFGFVDNFFVSVSGVKNTVADALTDKINDTIKDIIGDGFGSLLEGFDYLDIYIKSEVKKMLDFIVLEYVESFIDFIFEERDAVDIYNFVACWLFDRISLNKAEVRLTIWGVRG
jgi:hypothetical protein